MVTDLRTQRDASTIALMKRIIGRQPPGRHELRQVLDELCGPAAQRDHVPHNHTSVASRADRR